ncbi:MAG: hypothetical protein DRH08_07955 [Deltaproteobacteria bacterium]|nr:MAG: hypothetical protein DRH08_07955 [Deltaproteobacteria bacterium]
MAVIDELFYLIGYKTDKQSLNKAKGGFSSLTSAAAALTAGIVAANAALLAMTKEAAAYGDSVAKTAAKLGWATKELQGYRHAANLASIETRTFDMASQRMGRRISEAAKGQGEAKDALKELGLSAKELNKLSPDKQINALAKAFAKVTNEQDKVRLAMRMFDSEGVSMVNLLSMGIEGIGAAMKDLDDLGGIMSEEETKNAVTFTDTITRLWSAIKGLSRTIGAQLFLPLSRVVNLFLEWYKLNKDIITENILGFVDALTTAFGYLWQTISFLITQIRLVIGVFSDIKKETWWLFGGGAVAAVISLTGGIGGLIAMLGGLAKVLLPITAAFLLIQDYIHWLNGQDSFMGDFLPSVDKVRLALTDFFEDVAGLVDGLTSSFNSLIDTILSIPRAMDGLIGDALSMFGGGLLFPTMTGAHQAEAVAGSTNNTSSTVNQNNTINVTGSGNEQAASDMVLRSLEKQNEIALGASTGGGY